MEATTSPAPPAKGLAALPTELLLKIFADVPNVDLKRVAIAGKVFAAPAQERLFSTLSIAPRKRQLRVLLHVSKHPVLCTYLKHLAYDLSFYHYTKFTLEDYQTRLEHLDRRKFSSYDVLAGYAITVNLIREQATILKHNLIADVLWKTLPKLPKLKAISFSYRYTGPYLWKGAPPLAPLIPRVYKISNRRIPETHSNPETAFRTIFRALEKSGVQIKSLTVDPPEMEHFEQREVLALTSKRSRNMARNAFQSLTVISMRFSRLESERFLNMRMPSPPIVSHTTPTFVAELLQRAKGLKRLSFGNNDYSGPRFNGVEEWSHFPLFLQLGDGFRWHYLESLELVNMVLYEEEIIDFVNLHAATLVEVMLVRIVLLCVLGWNKVTDALKGLRLSGVRIDFPVALRKGEVHVQLISGDVLEREIMDGRPNGLGSVD
jgi:hypothetical protein